MKKSLYLLALSICLSSSFNVAIADDYYFRANEATIGINNSAEGINVVPPVISETTTNTLYNISTQPTATGGSKPYVWSITGNSEMGINKSTGALSGKPTSAGLKTANIVVTDSKGKKGTTTVQIQVYDSLNISGPDFGILSLGNPIVVNKQPVGIGGDLTYTWSLSNGPSWLSINSSNGHLAGTPTESGPFSFRISIDDTANHNYFKTVSGSVAKLPVINVVDNNVSVFTVGDSYNQQFTIDSDPVGLIYTTGNIPNGTNFVYTDTSATVAGTLNQSGNYTYQLNVTNSDGTGISNNVNVNVFNKLLLSDLSISNTIVGDNYNVVTNPVASGGNGNYTYSIVSQSSGADLSINNSTGVLSGIPTSAGSKTVIIKVVDTDGRTASTSKTFNVYNAIALSDFSLATPITTNTAYAVNLSPVASGGNGNYTYSIASQTAGTGLTINSSSGVISGTPTTAGTKTVVIKVADTEGRNITTTQTFNVYEPIVLSDYSISDSIVGDSYVATVNPTATGGNGNYTYQISSQTAGTGLIINSSTGVLSGSPTTSGAKTVVVGVVDTNGVSAYKTKSFTVYDILVLNSPVFGSSVVNASVAVNSEPSATGGNGNYSWSLLDNPSWMTINSSTGVISGTPTTVGDFTTKVVVVSGTQTKTSPVITGTVLTPTLTLATTALASKNTTDTILQDFRPFLTTKGIYDTSAIVWSATNLPTGLTLSSSTGTISGSIATAGSYTFTMTATYTVNGTNYIGSQNYTLTIKLLNGATNLSVGSIHACAVLGSGELKCWGYNADGEIGNGTTNNATKPVSIIASGVANVSAGIDHTCAVLTSGGLRCWGANSYGQLGNGGTTTSTTPSLIASSGYSSVSASSQMTCAIATGGGVRCWGLNNVGQLGNGGTATAKSPTGVSGLSSGATKVTTGASHACALMSTGGIKCWGFNAYGQLGNNSTSNSLTPSDVNILGGGLATDVVAFSNTTCAVLTTGAVKCWGYNGNGELGNGTTNTKANLAAAQVTGLTSGYTMVSGNDRSACVLSSSGGVKCWGSNGSGQFGTGGTGSSTTPVSPTALSSGVVVIQEGGSNGCALMETGGVKCWGYGGSGALGNGTTANSYTPVDVLL